MLTAAALIWQGAGKPLTADCRPYTGPCWWCGCASPGHGAPASNVPDTFPARHLAACPTSTMVCAPCAWTMCDQVEIPEDVADASMGKRIEDGGRLRAAVRGEGAGTPRLFLRLDDGRVGVWALVGNAASDEPWMAARAQLRADPHATTTHSLVAIVARHEVTAGPVYRFRNFHHVATPTSWRPLTNSAEGKAAIRAWLVAPPEGPSACVIGDGQKHGAIFARVSYYAPGVLATCYLDGQTIDYDPADLADLLDAVESLIRAGADDDAILSGRYRGDPSPAWLRALRVDEPVAARVRGSAILSLALFLRRTRKELTDGPATEDRPVPPVPRADPTPAPPPAPRASDPAPVGPAAPGGPRGAPGQQLSLFG